MDLTIENIPILVRRQIEAQFAGPFLEAFFKNIGRKKSLEILKQVIENIALKSGKDLAQKMGDNKICDYARGLEPWMAGDAYDQEILELSEERFDFNINRCAYAQMYKELGMEDLGFYLSCSRDFKLMEGFNPELKMIRTKTIMEGADCCDFRISYKKK
jgi:fumarate reductase iron-sulfur subunit